MKPFVLCFSGRKGAGKDTIGQFVAHYLNEKYLVNSQKIVKYSFADPLKAFCIEVLGLDEMQCYGTDSDKNTLTKYAWDHIPKWIKDTEHFAKKTGLMTARDVMQVFGTECVRNFFGNIWAEAVLRKIKNNPDIVLAIVPDTRFPNEVHTMLEYPFSYIVRLTRAPYKNDEHESETALDNFNWSQYDRCSVFDNTKLSITEQEKTIVPLIDTLYKTFGEL